MINFEEFSARYDKEHSVFCPHCGKEQQNDDGFFPVTYHGSSDSGEYEKLDCQSCEKTFFVDEKVDRTYKTFVSIEALNAHETI